MSYQACPPPASPLPDGETVKLNIPIQTLHSMNILSSVAVTSICVSQVKHFSVPATTLTGKQTVTGLGHFRIFLELEPQSGTPSLEPPLSKAVTDAPEGTLGRYLVKWLTADDSLADVSEAQVNPNQEDRGKVNDKPEDKPARIFAILSEAQVDLDQKGRGRVEYKTEDKPVESFIEEIVTAATTDDGGQQSSERTENLRSALRRQLRTFESVSVISRFVFKATAVEEVPN